MMPFASTFLSHSSSDKDLVEAVAEELGRRGVIAWLDVAELYTGQNLSAALLEAIRAQATLTVFLSRKALESPWVNKELELAIDQYQREGKQDRIKPVYLEDPMSLVQGCPLLRSWLTPEGTAVNRLGIRVDPKAASSTLPATIAKQLAEGIFHSIDAQRQRNVLIHIDQRGSPRTGSPASIPINHRDQQGIGLVFRPRRGTSHGKETIIGKEWDRLAATMTDSLKVALGGLRWTEQKRIYISGNAQLGLAYLLGHHFNRTSDAVLYCTDTRGVVFTNEGWNRLDMLAGGNPNCEANASGGLSPLPEGKMKEVVLVVGRQNILEGALPYLKRAAKLRNVPVAWVRSPQSIESSTDLKQLIADITALLGRLRRTGGCITTYLVLGLPFAAIPLLAAHMPYVMQHFVLLEYRGDVTAKTYTLLKFPS